MRKFSVERDKYGAMRFCLNNKQYFINGVLDQGYYPESLLTPPDDRAMIFDIQTAKKLGFNTIRKHIKIEPLRWYYHCDRTGLLVWQDLVNGGGIYSRMVTQVMGFLGMFTPDFNYKRFSRLNTEGREAFSRHLEGAAALLFNSPSVAVWTIFNEGWGQFDAGLFTSRLWQLDPTRPVDSTSGWIDQFTGDFKSLHIYYKRLRVPLVQDRAVAITEFEDTLFPSPHIPPSTQTSATKNSENRTFTRSRSIAFTNLSFTPLSHRAYAPLSILSLPTSKKNSTGS